VREPLRPDPWEKVGLAPYREGTGLAGNRQPWPREPAVIADYED
jgi:hypothetical protein